MTTEVMRVRTSLQSRDALYPDFTLTKDNCGSEPIHRPTAIQGHGHLLVIDVSADAKLHAVSAKIGPCLGHTNDTIFNQPLDSWLPDTIVELIRETESSDYSPQSLPHRISLSGNVFQITHHVYNCQLIIEFEPEADTDVEDQVIRAVAQVLRQIDDLSLLYAQTTRLIAKAFKYDRVMIYQFDEDQHGSVVGEHKIDTLEPFLGLHYPESDIPKMARDLFLLVKSRAIFDVNVDYEPLVFNPELEADQPYLDLSFCQLRATSPIHIQYMQNMGVASTLTFAIIIQGKLWGLIACHHGTRRQVLFDHKLIGESIADLLAKHIFELEVAERARIESASRAVESDFLAQIKMSDNYRVQIMEHASAIKDLCVADGAALITLDQCICTGDLVPTNDELIAIRSWLISEGHDEVYCTDNFGRDVAVTFDGDQPIGGMLSACITALSDSYLLWFRRPITQTTDWAGDPDNSFSVLSSDDDSDVQLSPRQSFAKWQVKVEGQSSKWEISALDMADRVRQGIFKKELRHSAMLVARSNEEFMQLTYAAAHDLQEPLRTQTSYLEMAKESLEKKSYDDLMHLVNRTENAALRMSGLVADLLDYSQLGATSSRDVIDLSKAVESIRDEIATNLNETKTRLIVGELPLIMGDSGKVQQLLKNLLTNAIKYVKAGTIPEVSIFTKQDGSFWTLNIKDNGIGIDPAYHSTIFAMFKRLHGKSEYAGTGIGLAICAKVAESMGAEIGVDSEPGCGSTFWIRLHNSVVVRSI